MSRVGFSSAGLCLLVGLSALCLGQESPAKPPAPEKSKDPKEDGIPVTNALVVSKCGGCHKQDAKGAMTRISWVRTTPEALRADLPRQMEKFGLDPDEYRHLLE